MLFSWFRQCTEIGPLHPALPFYKILHLLITVTLTSFCILTVQGVIFYVGFLCVFKFDKFLIKELFNYCYEYLDDGHYASRLNAIYT